MDNLIWISDFPLAGTSFAQITLELMKRIKNFKVYVISLGYSGVPITPFPNINLLPFSGTQQLDYYFQKFKPEKTVVFHSFYFLDKLKGVNLPQNVIGYIPIEGEELTPLLTSHLFNFDQLIVPSKYSQSILQKYGFNSKVVYHGVDVNFFKPENYPKGDFRWGYLGMNDIRKQVPRIMEAYSRLPKKTRGNLVIAAIENQHYSLTSYASEYKISPIWVEKKFRKLPLLSSDILDFYQGLDCYVNCATEAFGLPNLEAAACGIPSIALDHGASREIMRGGALYVKVSDFLDTSIGKVGLADRDDLYRKMKIILEVVPERKRLIQDGMKRAKEFSWEKAVKSLEDVLG